VYVIRSYKPFFISIINNDVANILFSQVEKIRCYATDIVTSRYNISENDEIRYRVFNMQ